MTDLWKCTVLVSWAIAITAVVALLHNLFGAIGLIVVWPAIVCVVGYWLILVNTEWTPPEPRG